MNRVSVSEMSEPYQAVLASPLPGIPYLGISIRQGQAVAIDFLQAAAATTQPMEPVTQELLALLQHYFADGHCPIPILRPRHGTPFQQRVWLALQQIPAGQTRTYGDLAKELGSCARAVAGACRANPLAILIPCHRAVAASGLGGYMGTTDGPELEIKRWLLHHEGHG